MEPKQRKGGGAYVLEAAVQDLQLLAGEAGLGLQLLQALGAMADGGQLQLVFDAVWKEETGGREQGARRRRRGSLAPSRPRTRPSRRGSAQPSEKF